MASFVKIWIHLIFSTKNRVSLIADSFRTKLFIHIKENAATKDIYIDFINGTDNHVHILLIMKPEQNIATLAKLIKGESSFWVNKNNLSKYKFEWQDEYIAISVSESNILKIREYIKNQHEHHRKKSFMEEYNKFIEKLGFDKLGDKSQNS